MCYLKDETNIIISEILEIDHINIVKCKNTWYNKEVEKSADRVIYIPEVEDMFASITAVIPMQLLSYHVAKMRGCDIDKPRNLAKSVTVE